MLRADHPLASVLRPLHFQLAMSQYVMVFTDDSVYQGTKVRVSGVHDLISSGRAVLVKQTGAFVIRSIAPNICTFTRAIGVDEKGEAERGGSDEPTMSAFASKTTPAATSERGASPQQTSQKYSTLIPILSAIRFAHCSFQYSFRHT